VAEAVVKPLKCFVLAAALVAHFPAYAGTLETVRERGAVRCGVTPGVPGFSAPDDEGHWHGLDVDFCRALAAAVLGDASRVEFRPLTAKERFTALQSGEVDVLSRSTTWTLSRDASMGINFRPITFFDGQAFLVRASAGIGAARELSGATICTPTGTTSELNASDFFRAQANDTKLLTFDTLELAGQAYASNRCDALTVDRSQLHALRLSLPDPEMHIVLPDTISKEPLGPAVRQGDDRWLDIVSWTHYALINAEELGVRAADAAHHLQSENPDIRRLMGAEGSFGQQLGLSNDWAYQIIRQVGNYGEIFDRNLGLASPLHMERGLNRLWSDGGLHYAPPIR
jgi:general L-amino acid transport system substrate-binding protein